MSRKISSGQPHLAHVWHLPEMGAAERERRYGAGTLEMATSLLAGEPTTVTFQFEVGESGLAAGGRLRIAWRWPIDWRDLQSDDPEAEGYMTVSTEAHAAISHETPHFDLQYLRKGDLDPWMHCIDLVLQSGSLCRGDRVRLACGDTSGGSAGWRAPTCRVKQATFLMLVNPDGGDRWIQLTDPPGYAIEPGAPVRLVAVAPAQSGIDKPFVLRVRAEDRWGNATPVGEAPSLELVAAGDGKSAATMTVHEHTSSSAPAVTTYQISIDQPGRYCLRAHHPELGLFTKSNPFSIDAATSELQLFWGDLHSGQTEIGCGAGTLAEHYQYARDVAGLQFVTHQANDHYITLPLWEESRQQAIAFNDPGTFVVFLGCEWSPPTVDGGDRNVIYRNDEPRLRRSGRFYTETDPDPEPDIPTAPDFHAAFADQPIMVNMHVGGRPTNLNYHVPALEPLAEIHSTHGTSEWFVTDALRRGYKVGITAGADGVAGRPGADHPGWRLNRNVRSGLTAVYATDLSREGLWEAFQARRCYATSGERIRLWTEVDGHPMGSSYTAVGQPEIKLSIEGTAALESVELLRGTEVLCRWQIARADPDRLRVLWRGAREMGTANAQRLVWNGALRTQAGHFSKVCAVGLQGADDGVELMADGSICWRSATAGNAAGFTFMWDGAEDANAHFEAQPCTFDFMRRQIEIASMTVAAGYVDGAVQVGPAPREDGQSTLALSYLDTAPLPGDTPYWVRVLQVDQARAWSSPVYVRV